MRQYREQKAQAGDALLLFRMGDFYELFYEDAELASRVLGITLTSRDDARTPMAGIPYHALDGYLARLVAAGYKVAISEQLEDPAKAKGLIQRGLSRIVTPGTLTDEALLDRARSNLVAAVCETGPECGIAALELSTGLFTVQLCPAARLIDELTRLAPAEALLPEPPRGGRHPREDELRERIGCAVTARPGTEFAPQHAEQTLREQYETLVLEGFGFDHLDASLQAAGALLAYVRQTQRTALRHIRPPRRLALEQFVVLDPVTLRSLELERTLRTGSRDGSLLAAVDRTVNPMGARLLRTWLCYPLRDAAAIEARQALVGAFVDDPPARAALRAALREVGDVGRIAGRLGVQRVTPRDLRALGDGLARVAHLRAALAPLGHPQAAVLSAALEGLDPLAEQLRTALRPDAPHTLRDGAIFADGHHPELDRLRAFHRDGQLWLAEFQSREQRRSGIASLKVAFNKIFGYYIEVTNAHRDRVPADYVRRQTVKNAERYITDELKNYESEALSAESRAGELEYELFLALRDGAAAHLPALERAAAAVAEVDVLAGWAELAARRGYCRPQIVAAPLLEIDEGRHPVVEQLLEAEYVSNDARLAARVARGEDGAADDGAAAGLALITGPNMAGKSTYIRQVALLTLLAHCGCWVPARRMRVGLVDRIFTRVGASDELARGQSTFMVEMVETANILHNATPQSLVILDEIGRGTSTYDGLALAWAITEHLASQVGCRTLFATHYHELTELAGLLDGVVNLNVAVREYEDQVIFLHRIVPGAADRSYGLHVAKLAGVPRSVLERANAVLSELERAFSRESQRPVLAAAQRRRQRQLRLFEAPEELVVRELRELAPGALDAESAIARLRAWRALLGLPADAPR